MKGPLNHSMEPTGASRSAQFELAAQWQLAPDAHAGRWAEHPDIPV
jgi:hypothetical protein